MPMLATASARQLGLRLRQRDAHYAHAVARRGVDGEAAPTAAHVQHALPLRQPELRADQLQLRLLSLLQSGGATREDAAAVGHRVVEEEPEEVVRHVVVVTHRTNVATRRVTPAARTPLGGRR